MSNTFIPDDSLYIFPTITLYKRMDGGPTDFRIPKPKGATGSRETIPRLEMRTIPFSQSADTRCVSIKSAYTVCAIGYDCLWDRPFVVAFKDIATVKVK
jgi:hypothetical protein